MILLRDSPLERWIYMLDSLARGSSLNVHGSTSVARSGRAIPVSVVREQDKGGDKLSRGPLGVAVSVNFRHHASVALTTVGTCLLP